MTCRISCCAHNHSGRCDVRSAGRFIRPLVSASCQLAFKQRVGSDCVGCNCAKPKAELAHALVG